MAMNGATLGTAIAAQLRAAGIIDAAQEAACTPTWQAVGVAIVAHIAANAVVAVASVSGVTVGAGVSGPGAGTVS